MGFLLLNSMNKKMLESFFVDAKNLLKNIR